MKIKKNTIQAYFKEQEKSQINNLTQHLKELEKEGQTQPIVNRKEDNGEKKISSKSGAGKTGQLHIKE